MATPTAPTTPTVAAPVHTKEAAIAYLQTVSEAIKGFEGKPEYNPFMYRAQKINPLLEQLKAEAIITVAPDGVRSSIKASKEDMDKIIAAAFELTAAETNFHYPVLNRSGASGADAYGALATAGANVPKPVA